jgi:hypothetical protein
MPVQRSESRPLPSDKTQNTSGDFFADVVVANGSALPVAESEELIQSAMP